VGHPSRRQFAQLFVNQRRQFLSGLGSPRCGFKNLSDGLMSETMPSFHEPGQRIGQYSRILAYSGMRWL
jgi:hypothetical protein